MRRDFHMSDHQDLGTVDNVTGPQPVYNIKVVRSPSNDVSLILIS